MNNKSKRLTGTEDCMRVKGRAPTNASSQRTEKFKYKYKYRLKGTGHQPTRLKNYSVDCKFIHPIKLPKFI